MTTGTTRRRIHTAESVRLCCDYVKETGNRHGVIDPVRFNEASDWLLSDQIGGSNTGDDNFGLDTTIWQPITV